MGKKAQAPPNNVTEAGAPAYQQHRQRLKQRFSTSGLAALLDYEVLELLLSFSIPRKDVKPLARSLLKEFSSLKGIMDAESAELCRIKGISSHTAILIKLVKEISSLYLRERAGEKTKIGCTSELLDFCRMKFGGLKDERFCVIHLDAQNRMIDMDTVQEGIVNQAIVYPRKVLEYSLKKKASSIILVHNHPSGHVRPSEADIRLTQMIKETAKVLDIVVHDHIIIGENSVFSFREEGILF